MTEDKKDVRDLKMIFHKNLVEEINDSNKYLDMHQENIMAGCDDEVLNNGLLELAYEEFTHARFFNAMLKKYGFTFDTKDFTELKMRIELSC